MKLLQNEKNGTKKVNFYTKNNFVGTIKTHYAKEKF